MLSDEQRDDQRGPDELASENESLVEEVRTELEAHDRRSEMESPDPATATDAPRRGDIGRAARDAARRLRENDER